MHFYKLLQCLQNLTGSFIDVQVQHLSLLPLTTICIMQAIGSQSSADSAFGTSATVQAQSADPAVRNDAGGTIVSGGLPQLTGRVAYNTSTDELSITGLGYQIRCPNGLKITWQGVTRPGQPGSSAAGR